MSEETHSSDLPTTKVKGTAKKPSPGRDVGRYVLDEYIKPRGKDFVYDTITAIFDIFIDSLTGAVGKAIYKDDVPKNRRRSSSSSSSSHRTNYSSISSSSSSSSRRDLGKRSSTQVCDIWVSTREDADYIVDKMREYIEKYNHAKVSDLYQLIEDPLPVIFTDYKYGWTDPRDIGYEVEHFGEHRGEYRITTNEPVELKLN